MFRIVYYLFHKKIFNSLYYIIPIICIFSGHVCIYCVENWNILDFNSTLARLIILDTEPIISLNISAHFKEHMIAASIKKVHFINFT